MIRTPPARAIQTWERNSRAPNADAEAPSRMKIRANPATNQAACSTDVPRSSCRASAEQPVSNPTLLGISGSTHGEGKPNRPAANATNSETAAPPSLPTERHGGHHRGPAPVVAAFRRGRDVQRAHDVPREHPLL